MYFCSLAVVGESHTIQQNSHGKFTGVREKTQKLASAGEAVGERESNAQEELVFYQGI